MTLRYQLAPQVLFESFDHDGLLIHLETETIFSLNETGKDIAQCIVQGMTLDEMVVSLQAIYAVEMDEIRPEVEAVIAELLQRQLIITR
jgi:hypothetical protein